MTTTYNDACQIQICFPTLLFGYQLSDINSTRNNTIHSIISVMKLFRIVIGKPQHLIWKSHIQISHIENSLVTVRLAVRRGQHLHTQTHAVQHAIVVPHCMVLLWLYSDGVTVNGSVSYKKTCELPINKHLNQNCPFTKKISAQLLLRQ